MNKSFKILLTILSLALIVLILGKIVSFSIDREIVHHCKTLALQEEQTNGPFFLSDAEENMCDKVHVAINVSKTKEARAF